MHPGSPRPRRLTTAPKETPVPFSSSNAPYPAAEPLPSGNAFSVLVVEDQGSVRAALVAELLHIARTAGCYGMWVPTEGDNEAALATYRRAGAKPPEDAVVLTWIRRVVERRHRRDGRVVRAGDVD
eukprot:gene32050-54469_t